MTDPEKPVMPSRILPPTFLIKEIKSNQIKYVCNVGTTIEGGEKTFHLNFTLNLGRHLLKLHAVVGVVICCEIVDFVNP